LFSRQATVLFPVECQPDRSAWLSAAHDAHTAVRVIEGDFDRDEPTEDALLVSEDGFRAFGRRGERLRDFLDVEGRATGWNARAERFKDYRARPMIGSYFPIFCPQPLKGRLRDEQHEDFDCG
jgi:hypothetical protein